MYDLAIFFVHLIATIAKQMRPGDAWSKIPQIMDLKNIEHIMEELIEQAEILDHDYLAWAALHESDLSSLEGIDRVITAFNKAGDICHEAGIEFAFHNHLAEFKLIDGKAPFDLILEQTDPDKVFVELDFFWAAMANVNAYQYFEQFPGRFRLGHVKDMATDVMEYFFVERDRAPKPMETAVRSHDYLRSILKHRSK